MTDLTQNTAADKPGGQTLSRLVFGVCVRCVWIRLFLPVCCCCGLFTWKALNLNTFYSSVYLRDKILLLHAGVLLLCGGDGPGLSVNPFMLRSTRCIVTRLHTRACRQTHNSSSRALPWTWWTFSTGWTPTTTSTTRGWTRTSLAGCGSRLRPPLRWWGRSNASAPRWGGRVLWHTHAMGRKNTCGSEVVEDDESTGLAPAVRCCHGFVQVK